MIHTLAREWRHRVGAAVTACALVSLVATPGAVAAEPATVDLGGTPIEGSTSLADATPIEAGLWSDTLGASEADGTHYFRYRRTVEDSSVHVSVVGSSATPSDGLGLEILGEDDTECASSSGTSAYSNPALPFGTGGVAGPDEAGDRESSCLRSDEVRLAVSRGTSAEGDLDYAIKVVEEAPLADDGAIEELSTPTTPPGSPSVEVPSADESADLDGGSRFDDAAELTSGGGVRSELTSGDLRFFKVRLGWGQRLSVQAEAPALTEESVDTWGYSTSMTLQVYDPMRRPSEPGENTAFDSEASLSSDEAVTATSGAGPVRYLGRFDDTTSYLPGEYWIAIGLRGSGDDAGQGEPIPVDLTVDVTGDVTGEVQGAPAYARERPYLIGPDTWSAEPSGYAEPVAEDQRSTVRQVGAGALGLVGLFCLGLAGWRLVGWRLRGTSAAR